MTWDWVAVGALALMVVGMGVLAWIVIVSYYKDKRS